MRRLKSIWLSTFDIREGERLRTLSMGLYLLFILFAYYVQRPVADALFLNKFDIDKLPGLFILIAVAGGLLAYVYTKVAVQTSLVWAVNWTMAIAVAVLIGFWALISSERSWMIYAFNVWVKLFSIVMVTQGWVVASNVFTPREAKRVYGLLGAGAVVGAAFGGTFTSFMVHRIGSKGLLLASALMVVLAYGAFRFAIAQKGVTLAKRKAEEGEEGFSFRDITKALGRHRHLQVIVGIITVNYMVDVLLEFQFKAMAKSAYQGEALTAFFGTFYGIYLNAVTITLQLFLTAAIVRRLGVGGTLMVAPTAISAASLVSFLVPGLSTATAAKLSDAASRYTLNRTGMELLYLPLPMELRNRTKAFVDIFVDRMGRGLGGVLLVVVTKTLGIPVRYISLFVIGFAAVWILLAWRARGEYVKTVRGRLDARRLDLESLRVNVGDSGTLALLEQSARGGNARLASYSLSLLADAPGYSLEPLLGELAGSPLAEVRGKVYELARPLRFAGATEAAFRDVGPAERLQQSETIRSAVLYLLDMTADGLKLSRELIEHSDSRVVEAALEGLAARPEQVADLAASGWIAQSAASPDPVRRRLAALAVGFGGDQGTGILHDLLADSDPVVVAAALRAAGMTGNRVYLQAILPRLADARLRGAAIESLAAYGTRIAGTIGDILEDEGSPIEIRRQLPRVLKAVPEQRSVETLIRHISHPHLTLRSAVLKALNSLRETKPGLDYGSAFVTRQILNEARYYFELSAILAPFRDRKDSHSAAGLLAASIEERLKETLERLFRLLGLRYPPKEIYAAYLAVHHGRRDQYATALEFLDNVLDRELKRFLLPLLDDSAHMMERGRGLFGVEAKTAEQAVRELIRSGDSWLAACAMAAAAELKFRELAPDIVEAARGAGAEVNEVALSARAALA